MKFILFVEGKTEKGGIQEFLKRWLDFRLNRKVGLDLIDLKGWSNFIKEIVPRVSMHLHSPKKDEIIAAIGLLDLYIPKQEGFFPNRSNSVSERYQWAKLEIEKRVNQPKFRMFFAVHEIESWLLSQPEIFPKEIRSKIKTKSQKPEEVNFDTSPAVFLNRVYQSVLETSYKKATYGTNLFRKLDPEIAYSRCPYLKQLLDCMETFARQAGL